jgi:hypothetical protein
MKLLQEYFELETKIHEYFGYKEDWVKIPLSDETEHYWFLTGESYGDKCYYSPEPLTAESIRDGEALYSGSIYTQRFLPKWVYRGLEYAMVCVDTHCDGNKFLMIFDNSKEFRDEELTKECAQRWSV